MSTPVRFHTSKKEMSSLFSKAFIAGCVAGTGVAIGGVASYLSYLSYRTEKELTLCFEHLSGDNASRLDQNVNIFLAAEAREIGKSGEGSVATALLRLKIASAYRDEVRSMQCAGQESLSFADLWFDYASSALPVIQGHYEKKGLVPSEQATVQSLITCLLLKSEAESCLYDHHTQNFHSRQRPALASHLRWHGDLSVDIQKNVAETDSEEFHGMLEQAKKEIARAKSVHAKSYFLQIASHISTLLAADILMAEGEVFFAAKEFEMAAEKFDQGTAVRETSLGKSHSKIASSLQRLARAFEGSHNLSLAEITETRAQEIYSAAFGPTDDRVKSSEAQLSRLKLVCTAEGN